MTGERAPEGAQTHRGSEHGPEKGVSCVEDGNVRSRRAQS